MVSSSFESNFSRFRENRWTRGGNQTDDLEWGSQLFYAKAMLQILLMTSFAAKNRFMAVVVSLQNMYALVLTLEAKGRQESKWERNGLWTIITILLYIQLRVWSNYKWSQERDAMEMQVSSWSWKSKGIWRVFINEVWAWKKDNEITWKSDQVALKLSQERCVNVLLSVFSASFVRLMKSKWLVKSLLESWSLSTSTREHPFMHSEGYTQLYHCRWRIHVRNLWDQEEDMRQHKHTLLLLFSVPKHIPLLLSVLKHILLL